MTVVQLFELITNVYKFMLTLKGYVSSLKKDVYTYYIYMFVIVKYILYIYVYRKNELYCIFLKLRRSINCLQ